MARATRTINPLHFEDLEPHRFEDLVRQLVYGFREWQSLEPTGRLGADEGIDIRALERVPAEDESEAADEAEEKDQPMPVVEQRTWIVQCKREKTITPKKIRRIVEAAIPERDAPYGFILAAACDFSKKTRDASREELVARGVHEFYLWGKADLEDMLYRPQNDHLLFAYFGISLLVRRRSLRSQVRSILAAKRKAVAILGAVDRDHHQPVLVRDAADTHYPYKDDIKDFDRRPRWKFYTFLGHDPNGLRILLREYFAYVADDEKHWDIYDAFNDAAPAGDDPWKSRKEEKKAEARHEIWSYWYENIPEKNRGTLRVVRLIPYEDIIDIDKDGDIYTRGTPHIFVQFRGPEDGPFKPGWTQAYIEYGSYQLRNQLSPVRANRTKFFPKRLPKKTTDGSSKTGTNAQEPSENGYG